MDKTLKTLQAMQMVVEATDRKRFVEIANGHHVGIGTVYNRLRMLEAEMSFQMFNDDWRVTNEGREFAEVIRSSATQLKTMQENLRTVARTYVAQKNDSLQMIPTARSGARLFTGKPIQLFSGDDIFIKPSVTANTISTISRGFAPFGLVSLQALPGCNTDPLRIERVRHLQQMLYRHRSFDGPSDCWSALEGRPLTMLANSLYTEFLKAAIEMHGVKTQKPRLHANPEEVVLEVRAGAADGCVGLLPNAWDYDELIPLSIPDASWDQTIAFACIKEDFNYYANIYKTLRH